MFVLSKGKPKTLNLLEDRENVTVGSQRQSITNIRKEKRDYTVAKNFVTKERGRRFNLWTVNPYSEAIDHPAIFPHALAVGHVASWTNPGDVVLDPHNGSGTTCKAAKELERHYIGIDVNQKYCDLAKRRLSQEMLSLCPSNDQAQR
jgi:site-specific DNA-methyltransferase (adenine-specific)